MRRNKNTEAPTLEPDVFKSRYIDDTPMDIPDADSSTLGITQSNPATQIQIWELNSSIWRGVLSSETYVQRERFLCSQPLCRNGGITHWTLVDTTKPSCMQIPLASCESYRKKALVAYNSEIDEVLCHGITSVFCQSEFRGRGYARRMMQEITKVLRDWQVEERCCLFTILYSDIGKKFYNQLGWKPFRSDHITISTNGNRYATRFPIGRELYADALEELCAVDEAMIRRFLQEDNVPEGRVWIALVPDIDTMRWHHAREEFIANKLLKRHPKVKGAIIEQYGWRAWCIWTRAWGYDQHGNIESTLCILRTVVVRPDGLDNSVTNTVEMRHETHITDHERKVKVLMTGLLNAALCEAEHWDMSDVQIWNPTELLVQIAQSISSSAKLIQREQDSIPSLMWYGNIKGVADETNQKIDWIFNEKYGWC